jgi:hypothetical protein
VRLREADWLTCGPYPSARGRNREGKRLGGMWLLCGLGRLVKGLGRFWPKTRLTLLEKGFEFRYKLEFEIELLSNSNFTQIRSK